MVVGGKYFSVSFWFKSKFGAAAVAGGFSFRSFDVLRITIQIIIILIVMIIIKTA